MKNTLCFYVDASADADTNRVIAEMLGQRCEERMAPDKMCNDGVARNLWNVTEEELRSLLSNSALRTNFVLFIAGDDGPKRALEVIMRKGMEVPEFRVSTEDVKKQLQALLAIRGRKVELNNPPGVIPWNARKAKMQKKRVPHAVQTSFLAKLHQPQKR